MYRGYDFGYGPRRRGRIPDFPFAGPRARPRFHDPYYGLSDPYLLEWELYQGRRSMTAMRQRFMRPQRSGISDWGAALISRQIGRAKEKILSQYAQDEEMSSLNWAETAKNTGSTEVLATENGASKSEVVENAEKIDTTADKVAETAENDSEQPALPIGPRIPAKQMWESCYRETMLHEEKQVVPQNSQTSQKQKNKQQNKKIRKGPYNRWNKRDGKKTQTNTNNTTEGADVYPRMCKVCNIQLTSEEQAKIHNESEIHRGNINTFLTGEDKKKINMTLDKINETLPLPTNTPDCVSWEQDTGDRTLNTVRFCRLCSVRMTSLPNAKQHYEGKSHAKRIRLVSQGRRPARKQFQPTKFVSGGVLGVSSKPIIPAYTYQSPAYQPQVNSVNPSATVLNLKPSLPGEFANSMTPSGQYYCSTCNIVIEHAGQLNTHLNSKEHKRAKARS